MKVNYFHLVNICRIFTLKNTLAKNSHVYQFWQNQADSFLQKIRTGTLKVNHNIICRIIFGSMLTFLPSHLL